MDFLRGRQEKYGITEESNKNKVKTPLVNKRPEVDIVEKTKLL
jgi:hypothetical protein